MHKSFLTFFIYISIALQSFAFDKDLWQNTFNKLTTAEHRLPGSQEAKQAATYSVVSRVCLFYSMVGDIHTLFLKGIVFFTFHNTQ